MTTTLRTGSFTDRADAGRQVADRLLALDAAQHLERPLVLALPRGGVPVAAEVARALAADLDVLVVRKIGAPGNPECAIGAVGEDGVVVLDHHARRSLRLTGDQVEHLAAAERAEVDRRIALYRRGCRRLGLAGRTIVIVDDGAATGSTAVAAVRVARHLGAARIVVAVPVVSASALDWLRSVADDVVFLSMPDEFVAVGAHYADFTQVSDAEVLSILSQRPRSQDDRRAPTHAVDRDVCITADGHLLPARLTVPAEARGVIAFAHGSGSSRRSPRNMAVARQLQVAGLGTLLFDLLDEDEAGDPAAAFDVPRLADRVVTAAEWLADSTDTADLPRGYFGASTGAAAALVAAAERPELTRAVVSRGGRPDLAGEWLPRVQAPTLLIVGGLDRVVLDVNCEAARRLACPHLLEVVNGAGHLFEEPGALVQAASLARAWFLQHLPAAPH